MILKKRNCFVKLSNYQGLIKKLLFFEFPRLLFFKFIYHFYFLNKAKSLILRIKSNI